MKIKDIKEPKRFFDAIGRCRGSVELLTAEGDRLNLRSTLCQYIALTQMFQDGRVEGVELALGCSEDIVTLSPFVDFE